VSNEFGIIGAIDILIFFKYVEKPWIVNVNSLTGLVFFDNKERITQWLLDGISWRGRFPAVGIAGPF
jgi:hypothetical protein